MADRKGHLLTCNHVIGEAKEGVVAIMRINAPYEVREFELVARSAPKDLAIIKIREVPDYLNEYPSLKVDVEKDDFGLGKPVATCGFPEPKFFKRPWVTAGIVSAITYPKEGKPYEFQVNISTMHGNSGGAVFTPEGYIVGMVKQTTFVKKQPIPYTTALHISEIYSTARTIGLDFGWALPQQETDEREWP